jgi:hypothetical protein
LADFFQGHNSAFIGSLHAAINSGQGCFVLFLKDGSRFIEIHFFHLAHVLMVARIGQGRQWNITNPKRKRAGRFSRPALSGLSPAMQFTCCRRRD